MSAKRKASGGAGTNEGTAAATTADETKYKILGLPEIIRHLIISAKRSIDKGGVSVLPMDGVDITNEILELLLS